jgi:hypothetical protein
MLANRCHEFWPSTGSPVYSPATSAPTLSAFMVCPFVPYMAPAQFAQMEYLYRVAYEQAKVQFATPATPRIPAFSLN